MAKRFVSIDKRLRKSYAEGRRKRGKPQLKPRKGRIDNELQDLSTRIYQNYVESWRRFRKDPKGVLTGKYPARGIDRHGRIVEERTPRKNQRRRRR